MIHWKDFAAHISYTATMCVEGLVWNKSPILCKPQPANLHQAPYTFCQSSRPGPNRKRENEPARHLHIAHLRTEPESLARKHRSNRPRRTPQPLFYQRPSPIMTSLWLDGWRGARPDGQVHAGNPREAKSGGTTLESISSGPGRTRTRTPGTKVLWKLTTRECRTGAWNLSPDVQITTQPTIPPFRGLRRPVGQIMSFVYHTPRGRVSTRVTRRFRTNSAPKPGVAWQWDDMPGDHQPGTPPLRPPSLQRSDPHDLSRGASLHDQLCNACWIGVGRGR